MLKKLSLSAEDDQPDVPDLPELTDAHSESRMLRALEALSSQPQPRPQPTAKPSSMREPFRADHGAKPRHRFVRDGEVPVVHMSTPRPGAASTGRSEADWVRLQQQLEEHKQRADLADRTRMEAQNQIKALQTKLAHAELALSDAQALAQARQDELQLRKDEADRPQPTLAGAISGAAVQPSELPVKRGRGRPRKHPLPELGGEQPAKRGPGRPRKLPLNLSASGSASGSAPGSASMSGSVSAPAAAPISPSAAAGEAAPIKRGPGRPRKIPLAILPAAEPQPVEWWLLPAKGRRRAG